MSASYDLQIMILNKWCELTNELREIKNILLELKNG